MLSRRAFLAGRCIVDDESGATAIEYGLIASIIAMGLYAVLGGVGRKNRFPFWCMAASMRKSGDRSTCKRYGIE